MRRYLAYGGGVNSTALLLKLALIDGVDVRKDGDVEAVFVHHGGDYESTYDYVDYLIAALAGRAELTVLKPNPGLLEYAETKRMVPNIHMRWCTGRFKQAPMARYMRSATPRGGVVEMMLGIDAGERRRVKANGRKWIQNVFPLVAAGINRQGCEQLIRQLGFVVPPKSGCWFCPYQTKQRWLDLRRLRPDLFARAVRLETENMQRQKEHGINRPRTLLGSRVPLSQLTADRESIIYSKGGAPPCGCFT